MTSLRISVLARVMTLAPAVLLGSPFLIGALSRPANAAEPAAEKPQPFVRLYDTAKPSPTSIPDDWIAKKSGWTLVPEDNLTQAFSGDSVILNDRLAVVVGKARGGITVFSATDAGWKERVFLMIWAQVNDLAERNPAVKIIENTPAAACLEATFETRMGVRASVRYRLTAGSPTVEIKPGDGAILLGMESPVAYVVVPDYFAGDMVRATGSEATPGPLPAENMVLGLLREPGAGARQPDCGDSILACLWQGGERNVGEDRDIWIDPIKDKPIWVAVLEAKNIWHVQKIEKNVAPTDFLANWKSAFPAKWRADCVSYSAWGRAESWDAPSDGQKDWHCVSPKASKGSQGSRTVIYPLDRSRATPLNLFTPMDIMRATLGVGPCQYVLDSEKLDCESAATPDTVAAWVEDQFKRKRDKKESEAIKDRLAKMVEHVKAVHGRIEQYRASAEQVRAVCAAETKESSGRAAGASAHSAALARRLLATLDVLSEYISASAQSADPAKSAHDLSADVVGLIGKEDALGQCQKLAGQIRAIGSAQDWALAECRLAMRCVRQECRAALARYSDDRELAEFAAKVRALIEPGPPKK